MMFTYAQSESALANLYGIGNEAVQKGAFRGRLKHLKRLGIPLGVNPGRGQKVLYTHEHLFQWAYCLELEEFGLDPATIVKSVAQDWSDKIYPVFRTAWSEITLYHEYDTGARADIEIHLPPFPNREPEDRIYLIIYPQFMMSTLLKAEAESGLSQMVQIRLKDLGNIAHQLWGMRRRVCMINVTQLVEQLDLKLFTYQEVKGTRVAPPASRLVGVEAEVRTISDE
jgi:hypothetical protein